MTDIERLRATVTGLIGLAATEEQMLLANVAAHESGSPKRWAAAPLVAHNTEFRRQQVQRLAAIQDGATPPEFGDVEHESPELYAELSARPALGIAQDSWQVAGELTAQLRQTSAADLLDPARNAWLSGRQLWLQVIVRGFWHPQGHLVEYYLNHGRPDRAVALAEHAVDTAAYLGAPEQARGMASYNLACARAGAGQLDEAAVAVGEAVMLNPDVRANAARDRDLAALRVSGRLAAVLLS